MFEFNPVEVGTPATLGMIEEQVEECVAYITMTYGENASIFEVNAALCEFGIDYDMLPKWLQAEFYKFL